MTRGQVINPTFYASNGYLVLMPDIAYKVGFPGQSAIKCVLPAIQAVVDKGYVDEKAIGIKGQSWGGYQIAYMVTQTDRFKAAVAGAPVSNMVSAYGGIRWGSGLPRQFQYERTQSRIGATLWEAPMRYIENSPVFMADRVKTPLLMIHNDQDDAVPWYQGIEYYLALRRLGKECYLLNYNGAAAQPRESHRGARLLGADVPVLRAPPEGQTRAGLDGEGRPLPRPREGQGRDQEALHAAEEVMFWRAGGVSPPELTLARPDVLILLGGLTPPARRDCWIQSSLLLSLSIGDISCAALPPCLLCSSPRRLATAQPLQTVAEKSEYKATSRYADVVEFCEAIAKRGPIAKLEYFGTSHEGRKLPLLVISDPPVATAQEAKEAGKLVVMAFANIHAGEVDGKEALLALARDLTDKKGHPLLKDLVILLVPILNADGNEKIDPKNRPGDNGPSDGAGTRANAQGLDLNRDFVKLESPEVRALVKLVNVWDPAMIVDCHTTNGSKHRYTLTYDGPRYPSFDSALAQWANEPLFPDVTKKLKDGDRVRHLPLTATSIAIGRSGRSYPASPRYGVQYFALRGKVGVLSESYSYASFKDRVRASHAFVTACFEVAAEKRKELEKAVAVSESKRVTVRTLTESYPTKIGVLGFEEIEKDGKRVATKSPKSTRWSTSAASSPPKSSNCRSPTSSRRRTPFVA